MSASVLSNIRLVEEPITGNMKIERACQNQNCLIVDYEMKYVYCT